MLSKLSRICEHWALLPENSQDKNHKNNAESWALQFHSDLIANPNSHHLLISSDESWLIGLRKLSWDSDFFQFGIGKIEPLICCNNFFEGKNVTRGASLIKECLELAKGLDLDHLSCQVHPSDTISQFILQRAGFFTADTIICYELSLARKTPTTSNNKVRLATEKDLPRLKKISGTCFSERLFNTNRFNSDPQFTTSSVRKLYEKWIENSIVGSLADATLIAIEDGTIAGFITIKLPSATSYRATIPLNAVHPNFHNRGIYKSLVDEALNWLKVKNVESVEIRTQLPNLGVHRTWQTLGAKMFSSYHTHQIDLRHMHKSSK